MKLWPWARRAKPAGAGNGGGPPLVAPPAEANHPAQPIPLAADAMRSRRLVFWLQVVYLAALALVAWLYLTDALPPWFDAPEMLGPLPIGVLWYGALGGVIISFTGVFEHRYDWDPRYLFWHVARPLIGAFVAVIAVLIVQSGILATGADPAEQQTQTQNLFYYVVAFLVGYREETFRGLMKRIADVAFTSSTEGAVPVIVGVEPQHGLPDTDVTIKGSGFARARLVRFGSHESSSFRINSDADIAARVPAGAGPVAVTVLNDRGAATVAQAFTID